MSKTMKTLSVLAVAGLVAVLAVGVVFAQDETPEPPKERPHGGFGPRMGKLIDRELFNETLADTFGISVAKLEEALAAGETPISLAEQYDVSAEDLRASMEEARAEAVAQAVVDGTITQEQAEKILERGGGHRGFGQGRNGSCNDPDKE